MMKAYLRVFVNWAQNNQARLLPIAEFAYNNTKNTKMDQTPFEHNCGFYLQVLFEKDVDPCSRSGSTNKLAEELRELIEICFQKLLHTQELQKKSHNKGVKSISYTLDKKVRLNSKYIKIKRNKKLENKFFGPFKVFYVVRKQAYKLKLPAK